MKNAAVFLIFQPPFGHEDRGTLDFPGLIQTEHALIQGAMPIGYTPCAFSKQARMISPASPDAAPVRKHTAADRGFAAASEVGSAGRRNQSGRRRGVEGGVSKKSLRNGANHGLLVLANAMPGASGSLALDRMQKKIAAAATGGIIPPPGKQNGNSR